jgi:hypothetical protein
MHINQYITLIIFLTLFFSLFEPFKNEVMKIRKVKSPWKETRLSTKINFIMIYLPLIALFTSIIMLFITSL